MAIEVPAVIEVCRPQPRHSQRGRLFSRHTEVPWHLGQTNPFGQRRSTIYSVQVSSLENRLWNSSSDFGNRSTTCAPGQGSTTPDYVGAG